MLSFETILAIILIFLFFGLMLSINFQLTYQDSSGKTKQYTFDTTSITG